MTIDSVNSKLDNCQDLVNSPHKDTTPLLGNSDCRATPGETPRAGIRQGVGREGETLSLPASAKNSDFSSSPSAAFSSPSSSLVADVQSGNASYVQLCTCNSEVHSATRVVGFGKLRHLLQPKHEYFKDKWAEIKYWTRYLDEKQGCDLVYPRVKTYHRENPYRRYQLNRQCSARSMKSMLRLFLKFDLHGFRVTDIETTVPASVSAFLAGKGRSGRDMAWNMNKRFWDELVEHDLVGAGHARRSNLHTWKSENPLEPHYHFHELVPNYEKSSSVSSIEKLPKYPCSRCGGIEWVKEAGASYYCATCNPGIEVELPVFEKREWKRQIGGTMVPFGDKELLLAKAIWLNIVINIVRQYCIDGAWDCQVKLLRFQRRYGVKGLIRLISFLGRFGKGLIDVFVSFIKFNSVIGKAKLMHKLGYNGRHPMEDYAVYSNKYPDCDMPPDFIRHYDNKARLHGWWRDMKKIVVLSKKEEKVKLSPYNTEPMEYLGRYSTLELFDMHDGQLVGVDFIRGSPVERLLNGDDKDWLKIVDLQSWLFDKTLTSTEAS